MHYHRMINIFVNVLIFIYPVFSALHEGFETTLQHFPPCRQGDGLIRNPIQCDSYYECDNGQLKPKVCPRHQHFKVADRRCVDDFKKPCQSSASIFGCPLNWRGLGDKCFVVAQPSQVANHIDACQAIPNTRLAEVRNPEQLKYLGMWLEDVFGNFYNNFYLNIVYSTAKDSWVYKRDNEIVSFELFNSVETRRVNHDCAVLSLELNYTLTAVVCTEEYPAICESEPKIL